jgi:phosphatidylglycerophosphate synthase
MKWLKNNAANLITTLRIVFIPYLVYTAFLGQRKEFVLATGALYLTDILDGNLAKLLHSGSEYGRKLDALADFVFYPAVLFLTIYLCPQGVARYWWLILIPFTLAIFPKLLGLYYLKRVPTLHLRIWQVTALPAMIWALVSDYFGFNVPILVFINFLALWGFAEEVSVYLIMKDHVNEELKSVFDIMK